ncbi:MAG: hypothetical protein R3298_13740, partial [Gammaproteobacteria bacterium]|nr:hypothetical protein [Gammaproteobacteria bacterium]
GIERLDAAADGGRVVFRDQPPLDTGALIQLVQRRSDVYRFDGTNGLRFSATLTEPDERLEFVETLLDELRSTAALADAS